MSDQDSQPLLTRLAAALESLVELRVTTCVGEVKFQLTPDPESGFTVTPVSSPAQSPGGEPSPAILEGFYTEINLAEGDILTLIPAGHASQDDPVRMIHDQQVKIAREIVRSNVNALIELARASGTELKQLIGPG